MPPKRLYADEHLSAASSSTPPPPPTKRQRIDNPTILLARAGPDLLSPLSDELLIRILSYLSLPHLLAIAPVSRRFHHLSEDSQLWKALYYARFVLPRAMRIPGFRDARLDARTRDHRLHYKGRRTLWADGRMGGLVGNEVESAGRGIPILRPALDEESTTRHDRVNWKRQYKIRHNWARGKCAVEELRLDPDPDEVRPDGSPEERDDLEKSKMLVKVVEGLAVTADKMYGLRAWDLKTREVMAQARLQHDGQKKEDTPPSCLAIDDCHSDKGTLEIAVGFTNGSFGIWRLAIQDKTLHRLYRHEPSSNGELMGMAYSHPYLFTATGSVLISLYTFDVPDVTDCQDGNPGHSAGMTDEPSSKVRNARRANNRAGHLSEESSPRLLSAPYLMTSLKSHSSNPPLALSIRKMASTTIASIAHTFFTRQGWSIGIQDLHITSNENPECCPHISTRLAYSAPFITSDRPFPPLVSPVRRGSENQATISARPSPSPSSSLPSAQQQSPSSSTSASHHHHHHHHNNSPSTSTAALNPTHRGPTTLCYTHPYLLATLPDNTLILHLCTSTSSTLSISPGIRLWGHTSGISDAEITARGKAVSVSSRGEEMRVWELEGRPSGVRSRSVEIRPGGGGGGVGAVLGHRSRRAGADGLGNDMGVSDRWEERRNWVGFDDEMVIVLKEAKGGRESLLVYDFT